MTESPKQLEAGDKITEEVLDGDGQLLYRATHEIVAAPVSRQARDAAGSRPSLGTELVEEEWLDRSFQVMQQPAAARRQAAPSGAGAGAAQGGDPVSSGLAVARFAWEFIRDNQPIVDIQGASTSVLSAANTDGLAYHGAQPGRTGSFQWRAYNAPFKNFTAWDIQVALRGTFAAQAPDGVPAGDYLPSVFLDVSHFECNWPHSAAASAEISNPSNIGTASRVNAMCDVAARINVRNVFQNLTKTFRFRAVGDTGFTREGRS